MNIIKMLFLMNMKKVALSYLMIFVLYANLSYVNVQLLSSFLC